MTARTKTAVLFAVVVALVVVLAYINAQNVRGTGPSRYSLDTTLRAPMAATGFIQSPVGKR